jgi:hypothetical protein
MRFVRVGVPLLAAVALLSFALWKMSRDQGRALGFRADRAQLKREFLERSGLARGLAPEHPREAAEESRALLRWYFQELDQLRARHRPPAESDRESRPAARKAAGADRQTAEEFERYAADRTKLLRSGQYDPIFLASAAGLRLDLLSVTAAPNPETRERSVRVDFALWGVPRRTERETQAGRSVERASQTIALKQLTLRFLDGDGKPYGEMSGSGEPYLKLADPERFDPDFPPGLLFGTWYLDLFPREASRLVFTLQAQIPGAATISLAPTFSFEATVAEDWKLPPGERFRGEVREDAALAPAQQGKR